MELNMYCTCKKGEFQKLNIEVIFGQYPTHDK